MFNSPPPINSLTPEQFNQGTANWLKVLVSGDSSFLEHIFNVPGSDKKMVNVTFPVDQMATLVSTPGGRQIEARFLVMEDEDPKGVFAIALYATDINNKRVSAYYRSYTGTDTLAAPGDMTAAAAPTGAQTSSGDGVWAVQVPHVMVEKWVYYWSNTSLDFNMFSTSYGPLQGYTFKFGDFVEPMFYNQGQDGWNLGVDLGLHDYYGPEAAGPSYTFGLSLRFYGPNGSSDKSFYDMSMPCPPGYYI
jgi:hypothetical protein